MTMWSSLRAAAASLKAGAPVLSQLRNSSHGPRTFYITPSRWQWHKFKDMIHYYVMIGAIPIALVVTYCNVFIGPAQLEPIPEDYTPKHWEYSRHPITRFIARYKQTDPQQEYEKFMHFIYEEDEKARIIKLENDIKQKMYDRQDYQAYYIRPVLGKYLRAYRELSEKTHDSWGDD